MKVGLWDLRAVCLCGLCVLPANFRMPEPIFMTWYYGTRANLSGVLLKSLPSVCVSVCVSLLSLLGKGPVKCILLSLLGNNSVKTFPRQRRIGGFVFCWVRFVSRKSRRLILPRTSCLFVSHVSSTVIVFLLQFSIIFKLNFKTVSLFVVDCTMFGRWLILSDNGFLPAFRSLNIYMSFVYNRQTYPIWYTDL
jgi:hypothetical protein